MHTVAGALPSIGWLCVLGGKTACGVATVTALQQLTAAACRRPGASHGLEGLVLPLVLVPVQAGRHRWPLQQAGRMVRLLSLRTQAGRQDRQANYMKGQATERAGELVLSCCS